VNALNVAEKDTVSETKTIIKDTPGALSIAEKSTVTALGVAEKATVSETKTIIQGTPSALESAANATDHARDVAEKAVADAGKASLQETKVIAKAAPGALKIAGRDSLDAVAYASAATIQAATVPVRFLFKLGRGIATGQSHQERQPVHIGVSGDIAPLYLVGLELVLLSNPLAAAIGVIILAGTNDLIADSICRESNTEHAGPGLKRFCSNMDKISEEGYKVTGEGDKIGAAIRGLFQ
jgi:hypothetical protein